MHNIKIGLSSARLFEVGFSYPWEMRYQTQMRDEVMDWWIGCDLGQWLLLNDIQVSINPDVNEIFPLRVNFILSDEENILYCLAGFNDA